MEMEKFYIFLWMLLLIKSTAFQSQGRSTNYETRHMIYKMLNEGEECSVGLKLIQANCKDSERALCVRSNTWKNLVVVCVGNILMQDLCPVFTMAKRKGTAPFPNIQLDHQSACDNCSHYHLWDVDKYPQCLKLEMNSPTTTTSLSNSTANFVGGEEQNDAERLSGGSIAGIVIGVLLVMTCILLVTLYFLLKSFYLQNLRDGNCQTSGMMLVSQNDKGV